MALMCNTQKHEAGLQMGGNRAPPAPPQKASPSSTPPPSPDLLRRSRDQRLRLWVLCFGTHEAPGRLQRTTFFELDTESSTGMLELRCYTESL